MKLKYVDSTSRREINNKKRNNQEIPSSINHRQIACMICTRLWMLDCSMEGRITLPPSPPGIEFSERTSGLDCIEEGDGRGQAVDNIDPLPPSLSLFLSLEPWRFLPWLCGLCRGNPDPFSSGINVTGRCSWRWKFRPVGSWTGLFILNGGGGRITRPLVLYFGHGIGWKHTSTSLTIQDKGRSLKRVLNACSSFYRSSKWRILLIVWWGGKCCDRGSTLFVFGGSLD